MGYSTMLMGKGFKQPQNSIKQIINYLEKYPFSTETQIQEDVFDYYRNEFMQLESNKKYADMLRRGLYSGKISRIEAKVKGVKGKYFYYIPR